MPALDCNCLVKCFWPQFNNMYGLLTKCEVKMAGYWRGLWTSTSSRSINAQKKNEANIQPSRPSKLGH